MRKAAIPLGIVLIICLCVGAAMALAEVGEGRPGHPVGQRPDWPEGLGELLTRGGRVYSSDVAWLAGSETCFYFCGDADDFNWFVKQYGGLKGVSRTLALRGGPAKATGIIDKQKVIPYDWMVKISSRGHLGIGLELAVGGNVDLTEVRVPPGMKVQASEGIEVPGNIHETEGERAPKGRTSGSPPLVSRRALYGKMAVTADATKILSVVLDESKGTRTGYDVLWADVDFNGTFEESERLMATAANRQGSWFVSSSFLPIPLKVGYSGKAEGVPDPTQIILGYRSYPRHGVAEDISVVARFRLREDSRMWEHVFSGGVIPSKTLAKAPVWEAAKQLSLEVFARPDGYRKGNLGLGLTLACGGSRLECFKDGERVKAHVEIKTPDGQIVHKGEAALDRFTFG